MTQGNCMNTDCHRHIWREVIDSHFWLTPPNLTSCGDQMPTGGGRLEPRRAEGIPADLPHFTVMRITVLAGGVGAARYLRGLKQAAPEAEITVVGNTGDDITLFGLRVCPDLDTVMYTLGGGINEDQGGGREGETHRVRAELAAYGASPDWFTLGDRDFATHILRSQLLAAGQPLSAVTEVLCRRWQPGVRLLPMSDDPVETHVTLAGPGGREIHFQGWWGRRHAAAPAARISASGAERARPAPGVLAAISDADVVVFPPSNPVVSIGTILAVPGIRAAVAAKTVGGGSPLIGGGPGGGGGGPPPPPAGGGGPAPAGGPPPRPGGGGRRAGGRP